MRVHLIANLTARGLHGRTERLEVLREAARGRATLHETSSVDELAKVAEQVVRDRAELVVLAGGDGTYMSGVTALDHETRKAGVPFPTVGLLPLGTVGTVARNFGERGDPDALAWRWLRAPRDAHPWPRPTLRVRAETDAGAEERVGFIVGTGLVARFFEVYEASGAGGIPLAGRLVLRIFAGSFTGGELARRVLDPIPCELLIDGRRHPISGVSLLCATVVRDLGLGMKVCYRAGERADRFHLVASALPPSKLGPRAPRVILGRTIGGRGHFDSLVERFEVRFPTAVNPPSSSAGGPYVLDGDMFLARSFSVTAGPVVPILGPRSTSRV